MMSMWLTIILFYVRSHARIGTNEFTPVNTLIY